MLCCAFRYLTTRLERIHIRPEVDLSNPGTYIYIYTPLIKCFQSVKQLPSQTHPVLGNFGGIFSNWFVWSVWVYLKLTYKY